jgi:hypothetical protein
MRKPSPHPVDQWARAFVEGRAYHNDKYNVEVRVSGSQRAPTIIAAYFHGNLIAQRTHPKGVEMSAAGYGHSPTTRSRLNTLCNALGLSAPFYQHARQLWYECRPIHSSEWVTVLGPLGMLAMQHDARTLTECGAAP